MALPRSVVRIAIALALVAVVFTAHGRIVSGAQTWGDAHYQLDVAPPRLAAAAAVHAGELPAWWDGAGFGVPLAAEPSHGAATPTSWIATTPFGLDLVLIALCAVAALGVFSWARRSGASERSAFAAAVIAATSGALIGAGLGGALPAVALVPWIGSAATRLGAAPPARDARDPRDARERARAARLLGVLLGAVALAGEPAVLAEAIVLAVILGRGARGYLAAAIGGGLAIGALLWVPAVLAIAAGAGGGEHGLSAARLAELVLPYRAGDAAGLFVGVPALALAFAAPAPRGHAWFARALAVLAIVGGRWRLGAPEAGPAMLAIVIAPLVAHGLDALIARQRRAILAALIGAGATLAIAVALSGVFGSGDGDPWLAAGVMALGLVGLALAPLAARRSPIAVLALVVVPAIAAGVAVAPMIERSLVDDPPAWATAATTGAGPHRLYRPAKLGDRRRELRELVATLAGTAPARWGIGVVSADDPARPPELDAAWKASSHDGAALLDRFGVDLTILPTAVVGDRANVLGRLAAPPDAPRETGDWSFVRFPATPPATVVANWSWSRDPASALAKLFPEAGEGGLGRGRIVLAGDGAPNEEGPIERRLCTIDAWHGGAIAVTCEAAARSYAVISSSPADGWSVAVDGQPTPWLTADVLRRAVPIEPGLHHITWRYTPPGLAVGVLLATLGLLALVGIALVDRR